jgi:hypothetical protein
MSSIAALPVWWAYKRRLVDRAGMFFAMACLAGVPCTMLLLCNWDYSSTESLHNFTVELALGFGILLLIDFVPFGLLGLLFHGLIRTRRRIRTAGCRIHTAAMQSTVLLKEQDQAPMKRHHRVMHGFAALCLMGGALCWVDSLRQGPRTAFKDQQYVRNATNVFSWAYNYLRDR